MVSESRPRPGSQPFVVRTTNFAISDPLAGAEIAVKKPGWGRHSHQATPTQRPVEPLEVRLESRYEMIDLHWFVSVVIKIQRVPSTFRCILSCWQKSSSVWFLSRRCSTALGFNWNYVIEDFSRISRAPIQVIEAVTFPKKNMFQRWFLISMY